MAAPLMGAAIDGALIPARISRRYRATIKSGGVSAAVGRQLRQTRRARLVERR